MGHSDEMVASWSPGNQGSSCASHRHEPVPMEEDADATNQAKSPQQDTHQNHIQHQRLPPSIISQSRTNWGGPRHPSKIRGKNKQKKGRPRLRRNLYQLVRSLLLQKSRRQMTSSCYEKPCEVLLQQGRRSIRPLLRRRQVTWNCNELACNVLLPQQRLQKMVQLQTRRQRNQRRRHLQQLR